jgi:hypothetical protein
LALSETKRLFWLFRFYIDTASFDVSVKPKLIETNRNKPKTMACAAAAYAASGRVCPTAAFAVSGRTRICSKADFAACLRLACRASSGMRLQQAGGHQYRISTFYVTRVLSLYRTHVLQKRS